jgi:FKBP-type peptidyl-prolyl cis-trans isomerase
MNRMTSGLALLAALLVAACSQQNDQATAEPETVNLDTSEKRLSYGIAYGLGERLQADGVPVDVAAFSLGLRHSFGGEERLLSQEEIGQEMQAYQAKRQEERASLAEAASRENADAGEAFRTANAVKEGVVTTESGLQYKVMREGDGPRPTATDTVEVNYLGTLIDGTVFDSSYARGSSVSFALNQVIPGWTEGLQLMPVGSQFQFVIPPELAYGAGGAGQSIGPNATLVFEVELLQIAPREDTAEAEAAEGEGKAGTEG